MIENQISNNNNNIFVNLPIIVLNKLVQNIKNDLDKIAFVLVCKRWYLEREKIIAIFNLNTLQATLKNTNNYSLQEYIDNFNLSSFKSIFERSLLLKDDILFLMESALYGLAESNIPKNVNTLLVSYNMFDIQHPPFQRLVEQNSNLKRLKITSQYHGAINANRIPKQIKHFETSYYVNYQSNGTAGFNEGIKSLDIRNNSLLNLSTEILPRSLKRLRIESNSIVNVESLPPTLEELRINVKYINIGDFNFANCIPSTLKRIEISTKWLMTMKDLLPPSLDTIFFSVELVSSLKKGDIPESVTRLDFGENRYSLQTGCIPPTIRHLHLGYCSYQLESIDDSDDDDSDNENNNNNNNNTSRLFFSRQSEYDYLHLGFNLAANFNDEVASRLLPSKIKELVVYNIRKGHTAAPSLELKPGCFDDVQGLEKLSIRMTKSPLPTGVIPSTVTEITILDDTPPRSFIEGEIPNTVQTLICSDLNNLLSGGSYFPPNIKNIHIESGDVFSYLRKSKMYIPPTVNNVFCKKRYQLKRIDEKYFIIINGLTIPESFRMGIVNLT